MFTKLKLKMKLLQVSVEILLISNETSKVTLDKSTIFETLSNERGKRKKSESAQTELIF